MRLLKADLTGFKSIESDESKLKYAILSHRWRDDEVLYQHCQPELSLERIRTHGGFSKIENFCKQARKDGIDWVWVDTCCIDKSSSAELSEAINSMFRWYRNARKCYAYLDDHEADISSLQQSDWFYRGWTLQELVAPPDVSFYDASWKFLGTKVDLRSTVSEITGIDEAFLVPELDLDDLYSASIAKRMSWASRRRTTRVEDIAYCLLGIFDINMPLLYGEGPKAFKRLQEEILKLHPEDHSLFAWGTPVERCSREIDFQDSPGASWRNGPLPPVDVAPLVGLLATSPRDFQSSRYYSPIPRSIDFYRPNIWDDYDEANLPAVVGREILIDLPLARQTLFLYQHAGPSVLQVRNGYMAVLLCQDERDPETKLLLALPERGFSFSRTTELCHERSGMPPDAIRPWNLSWKKSMAIVAERKPHLRHGDVLLGSSLDYRSGVGRYGHGSYRCGDGASRDWDDIIRVEGDFCGWYYSFCFKDAMKDFVMDNWSIMFGRVDAISGSPAFKVRVSPGFQEPQESDEEASVDFQELVFEASEESGELEIEDCILSIHVKREQIAEDGSFIDVVDLDLRPQQLAADPPVDLDASDFQNEVDNALPFRGIPSAGVEAILGLRETQQHTEAQDLFRV